MQAWLGNYYPARVPQYGRRTTRLLVDSYLFLTTYQLGRTGFNFVDRKEVLKNWDFPGGAVVKNPPANVGDAGDSGLIPGSGRSPGAGNGNPFQYS